MATPRLSDDSPTRWVRELATPRLAESGSRRLSDSPSFSFKHSKADSPTRRVGESATPRLAESESCRFADSPSRGVVFRLRISPRIWSQKGNRSKGSVRDLWGPNFCKNPRKSASLPCPFNAAKAHQKSLKRKDFADESFKFKKSSHGPTTYARYIHVARPYLVQCQCLYLMIATVFTLRSWEFFCRSRWEEGEKELGALLLFNTLSALDLLPVECNEGTEHKIVEIAVNGLHIWFFVNLLSIHNCFLWILLKMHHLCYFLCKSDTKGFYLLIVNPRLY